MNAVAPAARVAARKVAEKTLELGDRATGRATELPVRKGTLGPGVFDVASIYRDHEVFAFDPGFAVTASCESGITYIDGDAGLLLYRGTRGAARREEQFHGGVLSRPERRAAEPEAAR